MQSILFCTLLLRYVPWQVQNNCSVVGKFYCCRKNLIILQYSGFRNKCLVIIHQHVRHLKCYNFNFTILEYSNFGKKINVSISTKIILYYSFKTNLASISVSIIKYNNEFPSSILISQNEIYFNTIILNSSCNVTFCVSVHENIMYYTQADITTKSKYLKGTKSLSEGILFHSTSKLKF